jgi:hypothetical protein
MTTSGAGPVTKAAIVIGVDRTGDLTPLRAAASGAEAVGDWLEREGYHVIRHTDAGGGRVTRGEVASSVQGLVRAGTLEKLVIYFSGHGYLSGSAEIWLLTDAPDDPSEAINQTSSIDFARMSGIPSIIFISDACRSTPQTLRASSIGGASIFPNLPQGSVDPEIDRFFATRPGDAATELPLRDSATGHVGLFTQMLRQAHINPAADVVRMVQDGSGQVPVVPNRRLKQIVPALVSDEAGRRALAVSQQPQLRLECGEEAFVARAEFWKGGDHDSAGNLPRPRAEERLEELVRTAMRMRRENFGVQDGRPISALERLTDNAGLQDVGRRFAEEAEQQAAADRTQSFETHTGFQINGSIAIEARGDVVDARILNWGEGRMVRVHARDDAMAPPPGPGSVLIRFHEGTGCLLPALPGYIGSVTVVDGGLVNVSYIPSVGSERWESYLYQQQEVEELRSLVSTAARYGLLAVDRSDAKAFGDRVRRLKRLDPTLGLYAALAYAEVGLVPEARSVRRYMRGDLNAELFDVALLTMRPRPELRRRRPNRRVLPACPMLTQSWSYLQSRPIRIPEVLEESDRLPTLWTTFTARSMDWITREFKYGELR